MSKQSQKTYTTLRAFAHRGRVIAKGETVELHPAQAKYYLGSHLAEPGAGKKAKTNTTKADATPSTTAKGDQ